MGEKTRAPASDEVVNSLVEQIQCKIPAKTAGMIGVRKGDMPSEIIFITTEGDIPCPITEDSAFVYFNLPDGEQKVLRKVKAKN